MAITDLKEYAHLTEDDVREIGEEMARIRRDIESTLGERDARYIRNSIRLHRGLEVGGRVLLALTKNRKSWFAGTAMLGVSKIIENLELGHNTMHGQWDWMNDPEIHSTTWEWDNTCPSSQWKHSHNFMHHKFTNILGMDNDVGYGVLRVSRDKKWTPLALGQPVYNLILASLFQWAVAFYDVELGKVFAKKKDWADAKPEVMEVLRKAGMQVTKDYILFPLLTVRRDRKSMAKASGTANLMRNVWAYAVIFCGHFPDGAEKFTKAEYANETEDEWYLRQMLGSANFHGGKIMSFMAGNLNYQIEHHLFPDLPSNRYPEIAVRVRALCDKYDLPYNNGPFLVQQGQVQRTILKLALPDDLLVAAKDNAPETRGESAFERHPEIAEQLGVDEATGRRRGLRTGRRLLAKARRRRRGGTRVVPASA